MNVEKMNPKFKLIAFDLDGTLLSHEQKVTHLTKKTLMRIKSKYPQIHLVLASGRMTERMVDIVNGISLDFHLIGYNGGKCMVSSDQNYKLLFHRYLSKELLEPAIQYTKDNHIYFTLYADGRCASPIPLNSTQQHLSQLMSRLTSVEFEFMDSEQKLLNIHSTNFLFLPENEENANKILQEIRDLYAKSKWKHDVHIVKTECHNQVEKQYYVEILHREAHKGKALQTLCQHLGIQSHEVVVFGDGNNDIEMFSFASQGLTICMKNGVDNLKKIAHKVSEKSNAEEGVHHELTNIFFSANNILDV